MKNNIASDREQLIAWYKANHRKLPWRQSKNPYFIWISEVMLQQTTVLAVMPFYENFIKKFPTVDSLANSPIENIYESWAGLGYYSRARNLHKSAQHISQNLKGVFPNKADLLIELPGFGPYTSRAVASIAFDEPVGVLDGNVIRVLTRKYGLDMDWWKTAEREKLQALSNELAMTPENSIVNQALMDLGATVCTPKKPLCLLCTWQKSCVSFKQDKVELRPKLRPKEKKQIWVWNFFCEIKDNQILLEPNTVTPFLKNLPLPKSEAELLKVKPKEYDFKHSVTKYDIYVNVKVKRPKSSPKKADKNWFKINEISKVNPTSLMKKILKAAEEL